MPPRFTYWTIIFGGQPTSFRSATREELLPTFKQIQAKHPDALMKWFARGKLWGSEEEARAALLRDRNPPRREFEKRPFRPLGPGSRPPAGPRSGAPRSSDGARQKDRWRDRPPPPRGGEERRGRDWRPGGEHKDPRDRFKVPRDVKRARFKANLQRDRTGPPKPRGGEGGQTRGSDFRKPRSGTGRPPRRPFKKKDEE
jgi:hypothetical protein